MKTKKSESNPCKTQINLPLVSHCLKNIDKTLTKGVGNVVEGLDVHIASEVPKAAFNGSLLNQVLPNTGDKFVSKVKKTALRPA